MGISFELGKFSTTSGMFGVQSPRLPRTTRLRKDNAGARCVPGMDLCAVSVQVLSERLFVEPSMSTHPDPQLPLDQVPIITLWTLKLIGFMTRGWGMCCM